MRITACKSQFLRLCICPVLQYASLIILQLAGGETLLILEVRFGTYSFFFIKCIYVKAFCITPKTEREWLFLFLSDFLTQSMSMSNYRTI